MHMNKGQGSLEYLLILAAILAIAVVVVVVANSMLAPAKASGAVTEDKYNCGLSGIELKNYIAPYSGTATSVSIGYNGKTVACSTTVLTETAATCIIHQASGTANTLTVNSTATNCRIQ
jgi:uncharacterized protein (UPF0333 family)